MTQGKNYQVSGPLVVASGMQEVNIQDICRVGDLGFDWRSECGRTKPLSKYMEKTSGQSRGTIKSWQLGPPFLLVGPKRSSQMFDGIQRPLRC